MFALIETSGTQFRVSEGDEIVVDRVAANVGDDISLESVLLVGGKDTKIGAPYVDGATVKAVVVYHHLGDKVDIYKYRARQRYRKSIGYRARLSTIRISSIEA